MAVNVKMHEYAHATNLGHLNGPLLCVVTAVRIVELWLQMELSGRKEERPVPDLG